MWSLARIRSAVDHYQRCDVCQREGSTPLRSYLQLRRTLARYFSKETQ